LLPETKGNGVNDALIILFYILGVAANRQRGWYKTTRLDW